MSEDPKGRLPEDQSDQPEVELDEEEVEEIVIDPDRPACPQCGWHNTRLSHTKTFIDTVLRAFSVRAFRCRSCGNRFRAVKRARKA